jgi:hypothetical protein
MKIQFGTQELRKRFSSPLRTAGRGNRRGALSLGRKSQIENLQLKICNYLEIAFFVFCGLFCKPAYCQIGTNKMLVVNTNNVLPPNETNFFAVNSNLLNQSVASSGGGGGGGAERLDSERHYEYGDARDYQWRTIDERGTGGDYRHWKFIADAFFDRHGGFGPYGDDPERSFRP